LKMEKTCFAAPIVPSEWVFSPLPTGSSTSGTAFRLVIAAWHMHYWIPVPQKKPGGTTMGTLLLIILILLLLGSFPAYPYSRKWGYGPSGFVSVLLAVLLILLLLDVIPWGMTTMP
jgi:Protein of unknown function (DUF3309)